MSNLEQLVKSAFEAGQATMAEALGVTPGEISQRQARKIFGKWFDDAARTGRITPSRVGEGRNGIKHYRVVEITTLKTADHFKAEIQTRKTL